MPVSMLGSLSHDPRQGFNDLLNTSVKCRCDLHMKSGSHTVMKSDFTRLVGSKKAGSVHGNRKG